MSAPSGSGPTPRRRTLLAILLSLIVAGLGHIYVGRLPRALIWFGGIIVVALIAQSGDASMVQSAALGAALQVAAATDVAILLRFE